MHKVIDMFQRDLKKENKQNKKTAEIICVTFILTLQFSFKKNIRNSQTFLIQDV